MLVVLSEGFNTEHTIVVIYVYAVVEGKPCAMVGIKDHCMIESKKKKF